MSHYLSQRYPVRNTASHIPVAFSEGAGSLAATRLMRAFSISPEVAELLARLAGLGEREASH